MNEKWRSRLVSEKWQIRLNSGHQNMQNIQRTVETTSMWEKSWAGSCTSQNLRARGKKIDRASWLLSYWMNPSSMFSERLCVKGTRQRMMKEVTWYPCLPSLRRNRYFCPHTLAHVHHINPHTSAENSSRTDMQGETRKAQLGTVSTVALRAICRTSLQWVTPYFTLICTT